MHFKAGQSYVTHTVYRDQAQLLLAKLLCFVYSEIFMTTHLLLSSLTPSGFSRVYLSEICLFL